MVFRPSRIFRSRVCRVLGAVSLLVGAWTAWSVWPPQPELRVVIQTSTKCPWGQVTADGRSVVCTFPPNSNLIDKRGGQVDVFELPTGERRLTLTNETGVTLSVNPNGSCLACLDYQDAYHWQLRELPSGRLIQTLPKVEDNSHEDWSPDGRYFLFFNPKLSVYRADTGECVGRFEASGHQFACRLDGSGFVGLMNDRWELLVHSFDAATPDLTVPLPGPPAHDPRQPDKRPADGSVSIDQLATTNDGSVIFTYLYRYHQEGDKDRRRRYLARWDRSTHRWSEADMGPDTRWSGIGLVLRPDVRGRYLTTWNLRPLQLQLGPPIEVDVWGEEERKQFVGQVLWDATTAIPRCLNDDGFPTGSFHFDPTGRRILNYGHTVYDADTRAPLSSRDISIEWEEDPHFSADGRWVAISEQTEPWQPAWLPDRVANLIDQFLHPTNAPIRIIRLSDGKTVRQLYGRTSPTLTAEGHLWTVTEADRTNDTVTLVAERWSPEPPWPPWCLVLLSFGGVSGVVWDLRRARRTVRRSTI